MFSPVYATPRTPAATSLCRSTGCSPASAQSSTGEVLALGLRNVALVSESWAQRCSRHRPGEPCEWPSRSSTKRISLGTSGGGTSWSSRNFTWNRKTSAPPPAGRSQFGDPHSTQGTRESAPSSKSENSLRPGSQSSRRSVALRSHHEPQSGAFHDRISTPDPRRTDDVTIALGDRIHPQMVSRQSDGVNPLPRQSAPFEPWRLRRGGTGVPG